MAMTEVDRLKAELLRRDVELENAVRGADIRARAAKVREQKALEEVETLRQQLDEKERTRSDLSSKLQQLRDSTSDSSTEIQSLLGQIAKLEKSNRDTLSLLDARSTAHDRLAEDLVRQHQVNVDLRKEISTLEERNQAVENNLSSVKFRETSLQQEVELLKRNNDWLDSELKTKTTEHARYRKEKGVKITELQRINEDASANVESLQRTENTLREHLDAATQKADGAFLRIQQIQENAARMEESFRAEIDNARRLAELQKESADTARARVQELECTLERTKDDAAEELSQIQSELETERQERDAAEKRLEQLELQIEKLEADLANARDDYSRPGTPRLNGVGPPHMYGTSGSPAASPHGASRARGGLSFTQLYTEYMSTKAELKAEKQRADKLDATIDDMLQNLEKLGPENQELQDELARLAAEVGSLSASLAKASQEKELLRKEWRKAKADAEGYQRENALLEQQTRDLSAQIKVLIVEVQIREDGVNLSAAERLQLQHAAKDIAAPQDMEGMSDTARLISQRWGTFKDIFELQKNNAELLHLTRQLGERMEGEEARAKQSEQAQERLELESLRDKVDRYKDEMKSLVAQSQSYIRERDMFRRMLSHRGHLSLDGDHPSILDTTPQAARIPPTPQKTLGSSVLQESSASEDFDHYAKVLRETQNQFDAYRQEATTDRNILKEQLDRLAKEKSALQAEMARASSQLTLAQERYEMLQANYNLLQSETAEMQKRQMSLAETAARQDIRTQQVAEELVDAKEFTESLRSENANLKAERELWRRIESRLTEDNRSLVEEKNRTNRMLTDTQSLYNERELADSELRRKLQSQVDLLDAELASVKQKLDKEIEEGKKTNLRREYEQEQSRTRIDDLVKSLGDAREELAVARTSRDQLQTRVHELKLELRTAEERNQVIHTRLSDPVPPPDVGPSSAEGDTGTAANAPSHDEDLRTEVARLKGELDLVRGELVDAQNQVEQYKAISQSSEEELESMNVSYDRYREETERMLAEKEDKIRNLEERIQTMSSELSNTTAQLSEVRATVEDSNLRHEQQRTALELEVARVKDECERYMETSKFHQEDLKAQAEIAQRAQQSYEDELVKHAEAAKMLQQVRTEYNNVRLELSKAKADAEAARTTLTMSEESWSAMRGQYEKELMEIHNRRRDIDAQNKLLHQQLEHVNNQIVALQQRRISDDEDDAQISPDSSVQNLQAVIKYLRREKEIVDVQYELSVQEGRRLKQQFEYAQLQLDDARLKLDQERDRQADKERSVISHTKLMETINELNVFRESSVTLRAEARQAQAYLLDKSKQVDELTAKLQPLETTIRELENEREMIRAEMKLLEEDRNRWQQRTQTILSKYDRIDPAELEALKQQITKLQLEIDNLTAEKQSLLEKVNETSEEVSKAQEEASKKFQESRERLIEQFKGRSRELSAKIKASEEESRSANADKQSLQEQLDALKMELETAQSARDDALSRAAANPPAIGIDLPNGAEEGQIDEEATAEKTALEARLEVAQTDAIQLRDKLADLQTKADELQRRLDAATTNAQHVESTELLEKMRQDLAAAKQEAKTLRDAAVNIGKSEDIDAVRSQLEAEHQQAMQNAEAQFLQRLDGMKSQFNMKIRDAKAALREELAKEHEIAIQSLREEHETSITQLKLEHQKELEEAKGAVHAAPVAALAASENSFNADGTVKVKAEAVKPAEDVNLTDEQVRALVATSQVARTIIAKNIKTRVEQETIKLKEQEEKLLAEKLAEAHTKAEKTKEQAVLMEGQKSRVKISMADNKARIAAAKLKVVEDAANNTPQKPVVEVWAEAKDARPVVPVAPAAQPISVVSNSPTAPTNKLQSGHENTLPPTPTNQQQAMPQQQPRSSNNQSKPTQAQSTSNEQQTRPVEVPVKAREEVQKPRQERHRSQETQSKPLQIQPHERVKSNEDTPNEQLQRQPSQPRPQQPQQQQPPRGPTSAGTGPAALRGLVTQSSAIPRGGGVQRGAGRGGGRGRGASPTSMNPGARQFVPGNKRPRDGSMDESVGSEEPGKRIRGGAGGN